MALLQDVLREAGLAIDELVVLLVELTFGALHLGIVLGLQVFQVLLYDGVLGHLLEDVVVADVAEGGLCGGGEGDEDQREE